jgi:hypothetical protein
MRASFLRAAVALAALTFIPAVAQASVIVSLGSVTPAAGGFRFSYNVSFNGSASGISVESGDFFSIYDFAGFVPGSNLQPADWTFSSALTGLTPAFTTTFQDDPAVPNLSWTYSGASRTTDGSLGVFSAVSTLGGTKLDFFAAELTQTLGGSAFPNSNTAPVGVPGPAAAVVPEPGTLALLVGGVLGAFGVRRRRRAA